MGVSENIYNEMVMFATKLSYIINEKMQGEVFFFKFL